MPDQIAPELLHRMLVEWNDTARDPVPGTLPELFEEQVRLGPDRPALLCGPVRLSYAELDARADRLARLLAGRGIGPEQVVGLALPRAVDVVVAKLAVLKAGAAYLPIDPDYPAERIAYMVADARPATVLTDAARRDRLPAGAPALLLDDPTLAAELAGLPAGPLAPGERTGPVSDRHPAYVIYTSGSTGRPKAAVVEHRALADHLRTARDAHPAVAGLSVWHTSVSFAQTVQQLFPPLIAGGCVRITTLEDAGDDVTCTFLKATPSHLPLLEHLPAGLAPTGELMLCGEALLSEAVQRWRDAHPGVPVTSGYGPTEVTLHCTEFHLAPGQNCPAGVIPLGRVTPNSQVYVLDPQLRPVRPGRTGEIYLGGAGLARGYHRRPGMTAERFVADPFGVPGGRLYRTGDLGRWTGAGVLEFGGRVDDQASVRGFRVELGEVSAAVMRHPQVAWAVATVREDRPGDQRIVAYLVRTAGVAPSGFRADLRRAVRDWLPEHMVPSAFVELETVPRTPHGKLDRAALPAPDYGPTAPGREPADGAERRLCALLADVLGLPAVGPDDDFFDLGGHSLLAARLVGRVRAALGAELPLRAVFERRTAAGLVPALAAAGDARPALAPRPRPERLPLSAAQRRLWFLEQFEGPSARYGIVLQVGIDGPVDEAVLRSAFADVLARHEALRTVFAQHEGDPYQVVLDPAGAGPGLVVRPVEAGGLEAALDAEAQEPFDLATEIPLRAVLFRVAPDGDRQRRVLLFVAHHIAVDGGSFVPLLRDLSDAYAARSHGDAPSWAPLPVQYADFALWQAEANGREDDPGSRLAGQIGFWRDALAGMPDLLQLPTDRPRPAEPTYRGDRAAFELDPELHGRLAELARRRGSTMFMVLNAALAALFTRLGAGTDIPIGTGATGRDEQALEELAGFFVNTLVLRADTSGDPGFGELLDRVRDADLAAYAHPDVPFERLVELLNPERSMAHTPLFQVMLTYEDGIDARLRLPGAATSTAYRGTGSARFDLSFFFWERGNGLQGYVEYATDLYDRATMDALVARLVRLLGQAAADPARPISRLELLTDAERHHALVDGNEHQVPVPPATLPELFAAQVARVPDAPAVAAGNERLTYAELDARANRLARLLRAHGAGPQTFVGVLLPSSPDLVVALLAVLKTGAAYVAVDVTYPADRAAYMLGDVDPVLVLTDAASAAKAGDVPLLRLDDPQTAARLAQQDDRDLTDAERTRPLHVRDTAMVIYTSGSTGRPKGVLVEHHSLNHYLAWARDAYTALSGRALVHSSVSFDLTVTGIFGPLTAGGCLQLVELDRLALDPALAGEAAPPRPSFVKGTPSHLPLLLELPDAYSPDQQLVLGGEPLLGEVLDRWRARHPQVTVFNEYGPTETTVECMDCRILPGQSIPPGVVVLGRPSWNTRMYVLDAQLRPVPVGVPGELYIGGELVTRGYHKRPGLTSIRYVADPYGPPGARMYRSGDLGRRRADGQLEFIARVDDQVKIRGYRIELGEIEAVLRAHPGVGHAAVIVREDRPGDRRLVAYLTPSGLPDGTEPGETELRAHAGQRLPEYMVPSAFVPLDVLPLTPNGKLDRRRLPEPQHAAEPGGRGPRTTQEEILCGLFAQTLGVAQVGVDDNFFALGGHSLLAVRLISRIRTAFGAELSLRALFEAPTVAAVAEQLVPAETARPALRRMPRPEEVS
jgi:amino acid adenylation domain-containing protein